MSIHDKLAPKLRDAIRDRLGKQQTWSLAPDSTDADNQTLLFQFPAAIKSGLSPYFAASVKMELGARSDHFPVEQADVIPYVAEAFPDALKDPVARVRVLGAERTFWEKATILHSLYYLPKDKHVTARMSRHYYDVYRLSRSPVLDRALAHLDLLERVAQHKTIYFKSSWAKYDQARPGSLRLVPDDKIVAELRQDYLSMEPMFFEQQPAFDAILDELRKLEMRINTTLR